MDCQFTPKILYHGIKDIEFTIVDLVETTKKIEHSKEATITCKVQWKEK